MFLSCTGVVECNEIYVTAKCTVDKYQERKKLKEKRSKEEKAFLQYLSTLEKDELIVLVDRFAPKEYRCEIALKDAPKEEIYNFLHKIEKELISAPEDRDLLMFRPGDFLDYCVEYLNKLKMIINKAPYEAFDILILLSKNIESAEENGYLYCERYDYYSHDDEFFDYDYYNEQVTILINAIDNPRIQADIFYKYAMFCKNSDYFSISYENLDIKEKMLLLPYLDDIGSFACYEYIAKLLSYEEKVRFLKSRPNDHRVFNALTALYMEHGDKEKAIAYVETLLQDSFQNDYVEFLIQKGSVSTQRIEAFVQEAIMRSCYRHSELIMKYISKCEDVARIEALLEKRCPDTYYSYLKREKRIEEMHALLARVPQRRFAFYKEYKERYPDEAIAFLQENISEELAYTGDKHYRSIVEYLKILRELLSKSEFDTIISKLKVEYRRRRNFTAMLDKYFVSGQDLHERVDG